jgi:tetratricopeptide (TPR) repeat protein
LACGALAACWLLSGCAARGPLLEPGGASVELVRTPFHPQLAHQCGPAALATALQASGVDVTPETLTPLVYLPGRKGSLEIEMQAAPRRYDRISYPLAPDLSAITMELDAGRPVVVLHNYGLPFWPRWHYAVVIGYDPVAQQMVLRSGATRREVQSAAHFMRAWDNGGRWAIVLLPPGEMPKGAERARYAEAASAFERTASPASARLAFDAAIRMWPDEAIAWVGRGTANYRDNQLTAAVSDYRQALERNPGLVGARNNLAQSLLDMGCVDAARGQLALIDDAVLPAAMRTAVSDTRAQLEARVPGPEPAQCGVP